MWNDVAELIRFYESPLGHVARRIIRRRIRDVWPDVGGQTVIGLGYATPFLRPFIGEAARVAAVMTPRQGVCRWPVGELGRVALADEAYLALPDRSVDRLLLVHAIECTEQLRPMMREIWRVLDDGGRLLVVAPNRRGIWARLERTPFGFGRPYTIGQMTRMMQETLFAPTRTEHALFVPPGRSRMLLRAAPAWEKVGLRWLTQFSGVLLMEARKDAYAPTMVGQASRRRFETRVTQPGVVPAPGLPMAARNRVDRSSR